MYKKILYHVARFIPESMFNTIKQKDTHNKPQQQITREKQSGDIKLLKKKTHKIKFGIHS